MPDYFNSSSLVLQNATELQKMILSFTGNQLVYILIGLFLIYIIFKLIGQGLSIVKLAIFAVPIIYILDKLTNYIVNSSNPFVVANLNPFISSNTGASFPSEQTLWVVVIALIVFSESKIIGGILMIVAGVVGYSRVLGGVTRIDDIIASFVIAIIGMIIAKSLINFFDKKN